MSITAGSYKFYGDVKTNASSDRSSFLITYTDDTTRLVAFRLITSHATVDFEKDVKYVRPYIDNDESIGTYYEITDLMILNSTETDTSYEPYTGGEPAPNPKYPFPIKNTGDSGSVNESVSNSDNTESQTISFPLAQGQKLMEGDYLSDDGIHSLWNEDTVNGTTSTFIDAKTNGAYYCNQKVSGNLTGQTITFDTSVTNAIVQYELAQEQVIPYTEEQKTAWEQIKKARTYKNVTHISSEDETPANVEIEYVRDLETVINNLSN